MYRHLDIDSLLLHAERYNQPADLRGGHQHNHEGDRRAAPRREQSARDTYRTKARVRGALSPFRIHTQKRRPPPR